jgi:pyrroline-5-carboxylate reductase
MSNPPPKKLAILGFGKMGEALALGLAEKRVFAKQDIVCTVGHEASKTRVKKHGLNLSASNGEAVNHSNVVILCVKPATVGKVLGDIRQVMTDDKLLITIAAGISIAEIEAKLEKAVPIVRAMPNTPALIGEGITVYCGSKHVNGPHLRMAVDIFNAVGECVELDESLMDAATGLSGCGPAYAFLIMDALTEAGVKVGIARDIARKLVVKTLKGAAELVLRTQKHPALLKDDVTTPAGCAIDGLLELEKGGVRTSLIQAVVEATRRAHTLGK